MKFEFDSAQPHQLTAIESTVSLFDGQTASQQGLALISESDIAVVGNRLDIDDAQLLANLQLVQKLNSLPPDAALETLGKDELFEGFPNFTIEMETGTGKTYVYLRTALDLFGKCGFSKFIVVVPTIAIRAGVIKTLEVTADHFHKLYSDIPYRYQVYDSRSPARIRQFTTSLGVEFLVMTIDSFNKDINRFFVPTDQLHGETPLRIVEETRPILILDEPQNMGSPTSIAALSKLKPLFALRYSATHRDKFNLIYRLTPVDAYRRGLVKRIEVAGVEREVDANCAFIQLLSIKPGRRMVSAVLNVLVRSGAGVAPRRITVRSGTDLEVETNRPEYRNYIIDEINPISGSVRFVNNVELSIGDTQGNDRSAIFDSQIRYTIREHILKQRRIRSHGVKILSLFFIDRVANYTGPNAIIRSCFNAAFNELKVDFEEWRDLDPEQVQAAYFAKETAGGTLGFVDTTTGANSRDKDAFDLIMSEKERLLSFDEQVAFIFSHSALREGWDSPNVCQICTLNQTLSDIKKRQEIGRGVRLVVDQSGRRLSDPEVNVLTVVANESYETYVAGYQEELVQEYGADAGTTRIGNARARVEIRLMKTIADVPALQELWDRIRRRTRFTVHLDVRPVIPRIVQALDASDIRPVRVRVAKGRVVAKGDDTFGSQTISGSRTLAISKSTSPLDAVVDKTVELLEHGPMPLRLTRRTILEIYNSSTSQHMALANPHAWASALADAIREQLADRLSESVEYTEMETSHDSSQFERVIWSWADRVVRSKRGLYDHTIWDSDVEKRFAEHLDNDPRTQGYFKFPPWFTVDTPVGSYTPDWAVARTEIDEHGQVLRTVGFVAETKATLDQSDLRPRERQKIACAKRHFESLGVAYRAVTKLAEYDLLDTLHDANAEKVDP